MELGFLCLYVLSILFLLITFPLLMAFLITWLFGIPVIEKSTYQQCLIKIQTTKQQAQEEMERLTNDYIERRNNQSKQQEVSEEVTAQSPLTSETTKQEGSKIMSSFPKQSSIALNGQIMPQRSQLMGIAPQNARLLASPQMVLDLHQTSQPETTAQLIQHGYIWFSLNNRAEAEHYLQGLQLSDQAQLRRQRDHYKEQLIKVYTKDMADRTSALVSDQIGGTDFRHYDPLGRPNPERTFIIPIESLSGGGQLCWEVTPLQYFQQMIPVHALQMLVTVKQAGIIPEAFWVADKVVMGYARQSLDPILCCNFDRWFVGLARWE